jgi:hypothetical protein
MQGLHHVGAEDAYSACDDSPIEHDIALAPIKHPMAKRGFAPLPRQCVVERNFA